MQAEFIIAHAAPTIAAVAAFIVAVRNKRQLQRIEIRVNGRLDELLEAERALARRIAAETEHKT